MSNGEGFCNCEVKPELPSLAEERCPTCGKSLIPPEEREDVDDYLEGESNGEPDHLPQGLISKAVELENLETILEQRVGKRDLISVYRSVKTWIVDRLSGPVALFVGLMGMTGTGIAIHDKYMQHRRSAKLTIEDIKYISSKRLGDELNQVIIEYSNHDRYAAEVFASAYSNYLGGTDPHSAVTVFSHLLDDADDALVKIALLEYRSRANSIRGRIQESLSDVEKAIKLGKQELPLTEQVKLYRKMMSHEYIAVSRKEVLSSEGWGRFQQHLEETLDIMGIDITGDPLDPNRREKALRFNPQNPEIGLGVLMLEAHKRAADVRDSKEEVLRVLEWHFSLIQEAESGHYQAGEFFWVRYTTLAAQALALGYVDFAHKVLDRAKIRAETNANRHAAYIKSARGFEWIMHRLLMAALYIEMARTYRDGKDNYLVEAKNILDEVLAARIVPTNAVLLRAARFYQLETIPIERASERVSVRQQYRIAGFCAPSWTHWTYFPNLPEKEKLFS